MKEDLQLGYLVIEAADAKSLDRTFTDVLGMTSAPTDRGFAYQMDDWQRRFIVLPATADGLAGLGLVSSNDRTFAQLVDQLRSARVELRPGTEDECQLRAVRQFFAFTDPAGTHVEVAVAPARARGVGFMSPLVPGGFLTGSQGLGHVVVIADDRDATVAFYTLVMGFSITDTLREDTPFGTVEATFMHCNRRHHTLAIGQRGPSTPPGKKISHFMVQANEMDAVGMAYDRALDADMPIYRTLGRHPNDHMFSFYMSTTAGFDIEFGSGAIEVGDDWQVLHHTQGSAWGHQRGQGYEQ
jgi:2,3-dihydroxybiphenyl 1,2-dioxygenase